ncbi:MAG: MoxR family ATPase [Nitrospirae bacterium YQR-1]
MPEIKNEIIAGILRELSKYLQGKEKALKLSLIAFFSRGHLLIEDLPGLGKTTLAIAIAQALGLSFGRIQCTSDLLPTDITGLSIFKQGKSEFEFRKGPIFSNIVLVDEINRATPKTQSALLEAMGEKQVTIEETTYKLARPFFVIATQNPIEHYGTFPLPESQLDRFMMKTGIGYPHRAAEMDIMRGGSRREALYSIKPFLNTGECIKIQDSIRKDVYISEKVLEYSINIIEATRTSKYLIAGVSTRGALALANTARANAYFNGRDYVIPEDIKELAEFTIPHRVLFKEEPDSVSKREIIRSLLEKIPAPL